MKRWPFLYGPDSSFLVASRFMAFIAIGLVLVSYYHLIRRGIRQRTIIENMPLPRALLLEVIRYIEVVPLAVVFGLYVRLLYVSPGDLTDLWGAGSIHLAFGASWIALALRRRWLCSREPRG